jgi:hypothetical protein
MAKESQSIMAVAIGLIAVLLTAHRSLLTVDLICQMHAVAR